MTPSAGAGRAWPSPRRSARARTAWPLPRSFFLLAALSLPASKPCLAQDAATAPADAPIRAALSRDVAPFEVPGLNGAPSGFSVDLFDAIAGRLHRPITYVLMERPTILDAVAAGQIDVAATPITVNPELSSRFIFTSGYMWTVYQLGVRAGGAQVARLEDLKGLRLAVSAGTPYAAWADRNAARYGYTVQPLGSSDKAVQAVLDGHADVVLAGNATIRYGATQHPSFVPALDIPETRAAWAAPLRRTDTELRDALDDALDCLKQDGTVAALSRKWFGTQPGPDDLELVVVPGHGVPGLAGYDPTAHPPRC